MLFRLLNQPNNAYDHAFQRYVKPQNYNTLKRVWGRWQEWTPNTRYAEESARDVGLVKKFKAGMVKNPTQAAKAAKLVAQGVPHYHEPEKQWMHKETKPRNAMAKPTSTALGSIKYDPRTEIVDFRFRKKNGGLGKVYSAFMNGEAFYRWVGKSRSIGKYFNRYLKGRMASAG